MGGPHQHRHPGDQCRNTYYFRTTFSVPAGDKVTAVTSELLRDDGCGRLSVVTGSNSLAIEVHQRGHSPGDLTLDAQVGLTR